MEKIAMLGTFPEDGLERMKTACRNRYELICCTRREMLAEAKGADYAVLRGIPIGAAEMDLLGPQVKLYHRWGVGYDTVDVEEAGRRGIPVAISTGINSQAVAELAVLLMLACTRRLFALAERARQGSGWKEDITDESCLLSGKCVGLLGLGNIGSRVCRMVRAFGAHVCYYDPFRATAQKEEELGVTFAAFDEVVAQADILSLHLPLNESTYHIIGKETFQTMKKSAVLVNTARGGIVDTQALVEALAGGEIWGAALDTAEEEPLPADHPLFAMEKVIVLPHAGGSSKDLNADMVDCILHNIETVASGGCPQKRFLANAGYFQS